MRTTLLITAAAAAALLGGAASAQQISNFPSAPVANTTPLPANLATPGYPTLGNQDETFGDQSQSPSAVALGGNLLVAAQQAMDQPSAKQAFAANAPTSVRLAMNEAPADTAVNPAPSATAMNQASPDTAVNPPAADATVAPAAAAPAERTPAASVGGTDIVASNPVPDTPANRAKYGQPMSNAGRMTKAAGN